MSSDDINLINILCRPACMVQSMNVDDELSKCLRFVNDNSNGVEFEDYLSRNKIVINNELFNKYTDIFVLQNYASITVYGADTPTHITIDFGKKNGNYLGIVKNNGYIVDAYNFLRYPRLFEECEDICMYIPEENRESVKQFLYDHMAEIDRYSCIVKILDDHDLCILENLLCSAEHMTKTRLVALYNKYSNAPPNKMHMIIGIHDMNCSVQNAKMIIDFYISRGVKCEEYLLSVCIGQSDKSFNSMSKIISYGRARGLFYDSSDVCHVVKSGDNPNKKTNAVIKKKNAINDNDDNDDINHILHCMSNDSNNDESSKMPKEAQTTGDSSKKAVKKAKTTGNSSKKAVKKK